MDSTGYRQVIDTTNLVNLIWRLGNATQAGERKNLKKTGIMFLGEEVWYFVKNKIIKMNRKWI